MADNKQEGIYLVSNTAKGYIARGPFVEMAAAKKEMKSGEFMVRGENANLQDHNDALVKKRKAMSREWDWSKLPKNKYNYAIELYEARNISKMIQLHDIYNLSINDYCCGIDGVIMKMYKYAIENNLIYKTE